MNYFDGTQTPHSRLIYGILLERNKNFLANGIRFFMNIWGRITKKGRNPYSNHAEIVYWLPGYGLMTGGSIKGGFKGRRFLDAMPREHWKNLVIYVARNPLTDEQKRKIFAKITEYEAGADPRGYEYFNFLSWIVKIVTFNGVNLSKDSDKKMECYESVARIYNAAGNFFDNPEYNDIYDFTNNIKLKPLDDWEEMAEELLK